MQIANKNMNESYSAQDDVYAYAYRFIACSLTFKSHFFHSVHCCCREKFCHSSVDSSATVDAPFALHWLPIPNTGAFSRSYWITLSLIIITHSSPSLHTKAQPLASISPRVDTFFALTLSPYAITFSATNQVHRHFAHFSRKIPIISHRKTAD